MCLLDDNVGSRLGESTRQPLLEHLQFGAIFLKRLLSDADLELLLVLWFARALHL